MKVERLLLILACISVAVVAASGFGARFDAWDFGTGFEMLRWGAYAGLVLAAVALVLLLVPKWRAGRGAVLAAALVIGFGATSLPLYWMQLARAVPPINDITTDTANPPAFVAVVPLRAGVPVPATYPGETFAQAQKTAYPDILPADLALAPGIAFAKARDAATRMGWAIVAADPATGRIEATATTPWFGFKDDVVIRITPTPGGSRIDVRSVSRVGKSDLGTNAQRIRAYLAELGRAAAA